MSFSKSCSYWVEKESAFYSMYAEGKEVRVCSLLLLLADINERHRRASGGGEDDEDEEPMKSARIVEVPATR